MANELQGPEPTMDPTNLYREEIITDRRVGTIRLLTPITTSGATDPKRKVLYVGETQVLTAGGMLFILAGIIASLNIFFLPTSLFDTLVMLILLVGGLGLIARSLRSL